MSEQDHGQVPTPQLPRITDPEAWKVYWHAQDQPWRTEPEIPSERKAELAQRRAFVPDIEKGIYDRKDIAAFLLDVMATRFHFTFEGVEDTEDENELDWCS